MTRLSKHVTLGILVCLLGSAQAVMKSVPATPAGQALVSAKASQYVHTPCETHYLQAAESTPADASRYEIEYQKTADQMNSYRGNGVYIKSSKTPNSFWFYLSGQKGDVFLYEELRGNQLTFYSCKLKG